MSTSKPIFLDIDSSIVENNLLITNPNIEDEFKQLFGNPGREYPSKLIKPHPGFCIKTKENGTDTKIFVNICTTDAIPPPKDITEAELMQIIDLEEGSDYRVPMSIGEVRSEKDKKGNAAKVVDIAINPAFYQKIQTFESFKEFFMAVVFQGLENKYEIVCAERKIILDNRKAFGNLQMHRIQQREIDEKMGKVNENKTALEELTGEKKDSKPVLIETLSTVANATRTPEYRLYKKKVGPNWLIGEFKFPDVISSKDITVEVGEDRILLESKSKGYLFDTFVPYCIRNEKCSSTFDKASKILTITMPLIGG